MRFRLAMSMAMLTVGNQTISAFALPPELIRTVPADVIAAGWYQPEIDPNPTRISVVESILGPYIIGQDLGLLGTKSTIEQGWLELLRSWPIIQKYSMVLFLQDISFVKVGDSSSRLEQCRATLVIRCPNEKVAIQKRIQYLLNTFTNNQDSTLEKHSAGTYSYTRLKDRRCESWVVLEWGEIDDDYVISLGQGGFEQNLAARQDHSLQQQDWFAQQYSTLPWSSSMLGLYCNFQNLLNRVGPAAQVRLKDILTALNLQAVDHGLITLRWEGRQLAMTGVLYRGDQNQKIAWADAIPQDHRASRFIPDSATWFATLDYDVSRIIGRIQDGYVAWQNPQHRDKINSTANQMMQRLQIDWQRDVLDQLGDLIMFHNHPVHPLNVPLAMTILIEIKGNARQLKKTLDTVLSDCAEGFDQQGQLRTTFNLYPWLKKSEDGIWYLQLGLYGPALTVTDRFVVISYSPQALRENFK